MNLLLRTETGLVSLLLRAPHLVDDIALGPQHFADVLCSLAYESIGKRLDRGLPVDEMLVAAELGAGNENKKSNIYNMFADWAADGSVVEGSHIVAANTIRSEYTRREAINVVTKAKDDLLAIADINDIICNTVDTLEGLSTDGIQERPNLRAEIRQEFRNIADGVGRRSGLPTGLGLETFVPGGIPRDKVTVVFGETGTFKTTLKSNLIDSIARSGSGIVLDFSLEDSNELTRQRAISRASGVAYSKFATREFTKGDLQALKSLPEDALDHYENVIVIGDSPPTADEIIRRARKYKRDGLCAVVIDYLTMLDWGRQTERAMLNDAMVKFQRAAKRDSVAYIVVSQLNDERLHERGRGDARPKLRDLFGSSAVKNAAKLAVATYRPAKYGAPKSNYDKKLYGELYELNPSLYSDIIELWVRKNVLGPDNVPVYVTCDRETGLMKPLDLKEITSQADLL